MSKDTIWTAEKVAAATAKRHGMKMYRTSVNGADAIAFDEPNGNFTVVGGSVCAAAHPALDTYALKYRELFAPDGVERTESFAFEKDVPYLDAAVAARVVCGCPCDEAAWIADDGSHPIMRKQSE